MKGAPRLAPVLLVCVFLDVLPRTLEAKACQEVGPNLLGIHGEGGHKWAISLKVTGVVIACISLIREDWGAGNHFHVHGDVLLVFLPESGVIIVVTRWDNFDSDDVQERHASHTPGST